MALFAMACLMSSAKEYDPVEYVDCFIGTSNSRWMLGPYAQRPFGMIQVGPDNQGNKWMGGYEYAISSVSGFSHIHAWTMGGLMLMPATADMSLSNPGPDSPYKGANAGWHSRIDKNTEKASPGYYSVYLYDHDVDVEITATRRCSFQKYTFPECRNSRIIIALQIPTEWNYGYEVKNAVITKVSDQELEGYVDCQCGGWASWNDYKLNFVIKFSKSFRSFNGIRDGRSEHDLDVMEGSGDIGAYVEFDTTEGEIIMVQTSLSLVDIDGARKNMHSELDFFGWDFSKCVQDARNEWNALLGRIKVKGGTEQDKVKFYTNMYRAFAGKQTWSDVDGRYRDADENIRTARDGKPMYGGDAFWNSYWNLNGLWSIVSPEIVDNWVSTQLELFRNTGWTCKGPAGLEYSGIMEGSHEIALMAASVQKGIRSDVDDIYEAVHKMVTVPGTYAYRSGGSVGQLNLHYYDRYGYMPSEIDVVSKTLDYAYDDYCVGQIALLAGKKEDADFFLKRSQNYRNVFHPEKKYVVRRDTLGTWDETFDRFSANGFIEGNSWQYSWYVPHDVEGLIDIMGGKEAACARLYDGFVKSRKYRYAAHAFDRTEGQSAEYYINIGNEVNMCAPYIFNYTGTPKLCQKYTRDILDTFYGDTPYHGWEGDEDEGQLGAWFVMTAMGLFEMDGGVSCDSELDITSPLFRKIEIELDNRYYKGEKFVIKAKNNSKKNIYINKAYLNGRKLDQFRIPFSAISDGGELVLVMGRK